MRAPRDMGGTTSSTTCPGGGSGRQWQRRSEEEIEDFDPDVYRVGGEEGGIRPEVEGSSGIGRRRMREAEACVEAAEGEADRGGGSVVEEGKKGIRW